MIRKPIHRPAVLALLLSALLLAGCGFQPRGQALDLTAIPGPVHIAGIRPDTPLATGPGAGPGPDRYPGTRC